MLLSIRIFMFQVLTNIHQPLSLLLGLFFCYLELSLKFLIRTYLVPFTHITACYSMHGNTHIGVKVSLQFSFETHTRLQCINVFQIYIKERDFYLKCICSKILSFSSGKQTRVNRPQNRTSKGNMSIQKTCLAHFACISFIYFFISVETYPPSLYTGPVPSTFSLMWMEVPSAPDLVCDSEGMWCLLPQKDKVSNKLTCDLCL